MSSVRVGHVVQARAVALQELADGRVRAERPQQLDVALADAEQHGLDALLLDGLAVLHGHAEPLRVERDGLVEVLHGHSDVIDPPEHGPQSSPSTAGSASRSAASGGARSGPGSARLRRR